ncbi:NADH-quinone oxidoreductase subunit NuoH [Flavihumibacter petaseus]|uniref:NADH-quinone oxidoreductase subunit H n=1 Tax=Flavihumibacter petaseus NBRC 106054 TaxID=1220578 RepID=A0A0E9MUG0_9BACT|nr:NADH-quinone oxidoreductase subunit NuoH [Flavihumibacter petaseus]GAO41123.1 NADH--quinone oxidoreductase subunit H [Flavihumibacter petaseus NBRC 106054]
MTSAQHIWIVLGILFVLLNIAAGLIWVERRLLALFQDRLGPNRAGPLGILIVLADTLKLFFKEDWIPPFADRWVFILSPAIVVGAVLMSFVIIPFAPGIVVADLNIGLLFFLAMSSLAVYSIVLGGWASNNKYALLGALRGASQMIAYEVFMGLSLMGVVMMTGSMRMADIVNAQKEAWFILTQPLGAIIFFIAGIAETHRLPFDIPEAESELIAGYHAEYSGMKFGMFFIGEYLGITLISAMMVTVFFGGWLGPAFLPAWGWFFVKTFLFIGLFILLRASLPRPRYDQLIGYGWKLMLPLVLANLLITGAVLLLLKN